MQHKNGVLKSFLSRSGTSRDEDFYTVMFDD